MSQLHAHVCRPRDTCVERSATTRAMAGDPTDPPTNRTRRGSRRTLHPSSSGVGGDLQYVSVREHRPRVSPRGRRLRTAERDGEEGRDREGVRGRVRWTEGEGIERDGERGN